MTQFLIRLAAILLLVSTVFIFAARWFGRSFDYDVLAYTSTTERSLILYNLHHGVSAPVVPQMAAYTFSFSADGKLAFSLEYNNDMDIYVLDTKSVDSTPINITHSPTTGDRPFAWSRDGRYLAFSKYLNDQNALIYLWDGEKTFNITPVGLSGNAVYHDVSWSWDGRLAFTVHYGFTPESAPSEIYLWDGETTTNLSQTPFDGDYVPTWNEDGRLAFLSTEGGKSQIFVWDGASLKDELPDRTSFIRVAPEPSGFYSNPTWTNEEMLAFTLYSEQTGTGEIYVWDGQTVANISHNPNTHNSSPSWSPDGYWVFMTSISPYAPPITGQSLHIRDRHNNPIYTIDNSIYAPAWSADNQLLFCKPYFVLSLWNGQRIIEIASSGNIVAQWPGGEGVVCSSG